MIALTLYTISLLSILLVAHIQINKLCPLLFVIFCILSITQHLQNKTKMGNSQKSITNTSPKEIQSIVKCLTENNGKPTFIIEYRHTLINDFDTSILPTDLCKIIISYSSISPHYHYWEPFNDERFTRAVDKFVSLSATVETKYADFFLERYSTSCSENMRQIVKNLEKDIEELFNSIDIIYTTNYIQHFLEMIDDLWYRAFAESMPFIKDVEDKFHQNLFSAQINGITKWHNDMFEVYVEGKRTLDHYKGTTLHSLQSIKGHKISGKPWKDTNIARIFAEWWYYFGMMLPKEYMTDIINTFVRRFLSKFKNYHDFQKLVKIITIVFWATYNEVWYKDSFYSMCSRHDESVLHIFRMIRAHAISCGFVKPSSDIVNI